MESLLIYYIEKASEFKDKDIFVTFSKFYDLDLTPMDSWLESQFKHKLVKNNERSKVYREEGNKYFAQKNYLKCWECYTRSLCWAVPHGEEYATALANRSAISFIMKEYEDCVKDITMCLDGDYPTHLKPKVYIRKTECYFKLGQKENFEQCLKEAYDFLDAKQIEHKGKYIKCLKDMEKAQVTPPKKEEKDDCNEIPKLDNENTRFAYASKKIKLGFDKSTGRTVKAKKKIKQGDVLFIEKAFVFAPVFKESYELASYKCYNCLKDILSSIPCKYCTFCVFCDETCRTDCWNDLHKWECKGMQASIWYHLGIAFPAFRGLLKGVESGYINDSPVTPDETKKYGNKSDNYHCFGDLFGRTSSENQEVVLAAVVMRYLKNYTNFIPYLLEKPNRPKKDPESLIKYLGGLVARHITQVSCNASVIEHWVYATKDLLFPDILVSTACGVFPSVSMMNHSCKANVTTYFICDTIVVKALEDIKEGEEVFNCYGIDYRVMNKEQRQVATKTQYDFECQCKICLNPSAELDRLETYLCPHCQGQLPMSHEKESTCLSCSATSAVQPLKELNNEADSILLRTDRSQLENVVNCLQKKLKVLHLLHPDVESLYFQIYRHYLNEGDMENARTYLHFWIVQEKARRGEYSRNIGTQMYEIAYATLNVLKSGNCRDVTLIQSHLAYVEIMISRAKIILNLYYPKYIVNKVLKKVEFKSSH